MELLIFKNVKVKLSRHRVGVFHLDGVLLVSAKMKVERVVVSKLQSSRCPLQY